jgi:hypothetical protein
MIPRIAAVGTSFSPIPEGLSVFETRAITGACGDEAGFHARDVILRVVHDLVDPHGVDDHALGGEID